MRMSARTCSPMEALKKAQADAPRSGNTTGIEIREREFREITSEDVGRSMFSAFGRQWPVSNFIGHIYSADIGKRVYHTSEHVVSVENFEQFRARRAAEDRSQG